MTGRVTTTTMLSYLIDTTDTVIEGLHRLTLRFLRGVTLRFLRFASGWPATRGTEPGCHGLQ
jgi:hypothetical protein